jgi:hypothetical protein
MYYKYIILVEDKSLKEPLLDNKLCNFLSNKLSNFIKYYFIKKNN